MLIRSLLLSALAFTFACSDDGDVTPDASVDAPGVVDLLADTADTPDAPGGDVGRVDALVDVEAPRDAGFAECTGACATQTLTGDFGGQTFSLERAFYGIDRDASNNAGVYIEAYRNFPDECPEESSPTPDQTLIISGLPLPSQGGVVTEADGLVVSLMDFAGDVLDGELLTKATAAEVRFSAALTCPSCVGMTPPSHPEGFVGLELSATFSQGTISGHLYARHCDSLDL